MIKSLVLSMVLVLPSGLAFAGPGHDHSHGFELPAKMTEADTLKAVNGTINALIAQEYGVDGAVLNESWKNVTDAHKTIQERNVSYSIVRVKHPTEDKSLYLLFSSIGELYDATFTGQFEGL